MLVNREVILAAVESTYNVDVAPTAAADAILVENSSWANENVNMVDRPAVRANIGTLKKIYAGALMTISFTCEMKGSGAIDTPPEIGVLLRGCGMGETINASTSVVYAPVSTGHESLTIYYFQDGTLRKLTGAVGNVKFTLASGGKPMAEFTFTGHIKTKLAAAGGSATTLVLPAAFPTTDDVFNGQKVKIISGTGVGEEGTITDYTGSTRTATVSGFSTGPDATSIVSLDNGPIDRAIVTPTYDATSPVPLIAVPFTVDSYGAVIQQIELDMANEISAVPDISSPDGFGQCRITKRDPNGSFDPEAVLVATKDFEGAFKASSALAVDSGTIGDTEGNRMRFQMPAISYREIAPGDRNGVRTYQIGYGAAESSGDDEITATFT
jgi:hypothetical protein